jgi:hypothetical protein
MGRVLDCEMRSVRLQTVSPQCGSSGKSRVPFYAESRVNSPGTPQRVSPKWVTGPTRRLWRRPRRDLRQQLVVRRVEVGRCSRPASAWRDPSIRPRTKRSMLVITC